MSSDEKKPIESKWTFVVGTSPIRTLFFALVLLSTVLYAVNSVTGTVPALQHDVLFASEPKLDASSMEALDRSLNEMSNTLPESERQEFSQIIEFLITRNYEFSMGTPPPDYFVGELKPWHGYTARRLVAAHRDDYAASLAEAQGQREREAEEAREFQAERVKKGHEEVRRLKAEIAREPELRALLSKVDIRITSEKWNRATFRKPIADGGGEFRGYFLDLEFVLRNNTDISLEEVDIRLELFDRRDGSVVDREVVTLDFGPPEDPFTYEIIGEADPILPGTSETFFRERLFEVDNLPLSSNIDTDYLKSLMRLEARVISIKDAQGRRSAGLWQIDKARRELEAWEKFLAGE